jgi:ribosomal protein L20
LADIAVNDQSGFKAICDQAKKALEKAAK